MDDRKIDKELTESIIQIMNEVLLMGLREETDTIDNSPAKSEEDVSTTMKLLENMEKMNERFHVCHLFFDIDYMWLVDLPRFLNQSELFDRTENQ
ncbi:hypothetical protein D3C80_1957430 [compost metagenome]